MTWRMRADAASRRTVRTTALGLGVALLGGGAALAAPGLLTDGDADDPVTFVAATAEDEEQRDTLAEHCATEAGIDDPFCSGPSDQDPPGDGDQDGDEDEGDDGDQDDDGQDDDAAGGDQDDDAEGSADGAERGTSERVHRALTGGDELRPGDPGFGQAVAARACSGQLGALVSRAARGEVLSDEDLVLPPCEPRGRRATDPEAETEDGGDEDGGDDAEVDDTSGDAPAVGSKGQGTAKGGGEGRGRPDRDTEAGPSRGGPPSHAGATAGGDDQRAGKGAGAGKGNGAAGRGGGRG